MKGKEQENGKRERRHAEIHGLKRRGSVTGVEVEGAE
jgi:hypothetical protein